MRSGSTLFLIALIVYKVIACSYATFSMKFRQLQENLRRHLLETISRKELTALGLARQTGFQQPHITNFLNRKRFLSVEAMDRVLSVQKMSVLDLLDPDEINKRASILPPSEGDFENVLLVEGTIAAGEPIITNERVKDILKFKKSFLRRLRRLLTRPVMTGRVLC
jgi:hypothetical protein